MSRRWIMANPVIAPITPPYATKQLLLPMLSPTEAAALLGVRESTLRTWIRDGLIPSVRIGRTIRLRVSDLKELTGER
jgi:excisionase family DNA binding protein